MLFCQAIGRIIRNISVFLHSVRDAFPLSVGYIFFYQVSKIEEIVSNEN